MIDHSQTGVRCRTICYLNTVEGLLRRDSHGTIRCELDNLDRHLVFVDRDNSMKVPVFPHEIAVLTLKKTEVDLLSV